MPWVFSPGLQPGLDCVAVVELKNEWHKLCEIQSSQKISVFIPVSLGDEISVLFMLANRF